jgi:hypothetical protein
MVLVEEKKLNFSLLVPVLNPKSTTFSHLVPVQSPQEIKEKNSGICTGPNTLFLDIKNFGNILELHLVHGTTFQNLKTKIR